MREQASKGRTYVTLLPPHRYALPNIPAAQRVYGPHQAQVLAESAAVWQRKRYPHRVSACVTLCLRMSCSGCSSGSSQEDDSPDPFCEKHTTLRWQLERVQGLDAC